MAESCLAVVGMNSVLLWTSRPLVCRKRLCTALKVAMNGGWKQTWSLSLGGFRPIWPCRDPATLICGGSMAGWGMWRKAVASWPTFETSGLLWPD